MFESQQSIYRRRRLVAAGAAALGVALLTWLVAAVTGGTNRPDPDRAVQVPDQRSPSSAPPATAARPAPSSVADSPAPTSVAVCPDESVTLVAEVDGAPPEAPRFPVGHRPSLRLVISNTGGVPCLRDVGPGAQQLVITTATGGRVWSSDDCDQERTRDERVLNPGERIVSSLTWSGTDSRPGCARDRTPVGPGAYLVIPRLDAHAGRATPFVIVA